MSAIEQTSEGLRLKIILQPKASKDQIVGLHDDELKITITAPPVDGQANAHLLKFLSKTFKVPKSSIVLEKGELNRHKQVWIPSRVLESEIKQDAGKGNTEKKEEELAELKAKAQSATAAQMSTLADANKSVEEAAKAENSNTEDTATKNNTDKSEKTQESAGAAAEETDSVKNTDIKGETQVTVETPTLENAQNATQQAVYTPIDIRL